ncbi:amidohydrolase family protein [Nocardioides mesophilus]|uniref:amidohydrolase family protein n=1 Tax=Nocardioides mesophilus TaxID=433659 RepID=UPI001FEBFFB3|nr:amidohydrolase family protein [Nocardioides mesophilus]
MPLDDSGVPGWWAGLGLPGLVDVHVHFLPPSILARVREQFDNAGPLIGRPWPLHYRGDDEERIAQLRALGVRRFTALPYAHRPEVAEWLNGWAAELSAAVPEVIGSATFFPEPGVEEYVAARIESGTEVFKVHVQVGDFDVLDPLLTPVWGSLADAGTPVVIHINSGPVATPRTGPEPLRALMAAHPDLTLVLAHMGAPHYDEFMAVAEKHERVHLDTTMAFTDFWEEMAPFPRDLLPRLRDLQPKVLLGSDFPNIPYPYAQQLHALERLDLGDDWLRDVCWGNGSRLFGVPDPRVR